MIATEKDYDEILSLFRKHRPTFPHLRPQSLLESIECENMVWSMGVAIQFKVYQRKSRIGNFNCRKGDLHLMKMVSGKGQGETILKRWYYSYGKGRVVLSVREDNERAINLYKRLNFETVGEVSWGDDQIKGLVMKLDF